MYEIVIICVNVVVYAVCKGGRQFNPSPINIKGLVSQKSQELSMKQMFVECRLISPKFRSFI